MFLLVVDVEVKGTGIEELFICCSVAGHVRLLIPFVQDWLAWAADEEPKLKRQKRAALSHEGSEGALHIVAYLRCSIANLG